MTETIEQEKFTSELFDLLDEVFVTHHGIFLDRGDSLLETLESISAEDASVAIGGTCASLAAQVKHATYYLEVLEGHIVSRPLKNVDWAHIWRTIEKVSPEEWTDYRRELKTTYERVLDVLRNVQTWNDEDTIGGAMAIMVHTAFHLGQIRQSLCTLR